MRKLVPLTLAAALVGGCSAYNPADRAVVGGLVGAGAGAAIGGAATGRGSGALAGAAIGGATGAVLGAASTPRLCWYRDARGRTFQARC